jgi:pyruvate/2-oxoglutarate dehydrogenase complex dihydrolipoamide dehydrogenase (E3) component
MMGFDIAVVGAGPAGIAAATSAARLDANVVLISETADATGQLRSELASRGAGLIANAYVWGVWPGFELALHSASGAQLVQAKRVILATGSTAVVRSFPGSDLPGVMTGDGLLRMLRVHGVWPGGSRVAIVGDDSEMIEQVNDAVEEAGGELVALIDGDPVAYADNGVLSAIGRADDHERTETEIATLCWGRRPDTALALMLECATGCSDALGGFVPVRSQTLEATTQGVYSCGDCAGIGSIEAARIEGELAGASAAESLGHAGGQEVAILQKRLMQEHPDRVLASNEVQATWRQHAIESVRAGRTS